jgi:hypothetical protein
MQMETNWSSVFAHGIPSFADSKTVLLNPIRAGAVYPPSRYREYHPGGYSSPPDYYDPYEYEPPRVYRQRRPPVEVDRRGPDAPSPQEVMAAR